MANPFNFNLNPLIGDDDDEGPVKSESQAAPEETRPSQTVEGDPPKRGGSQVEASLSAEQDRAGSVLNPLRDEPDDEEEFAPAATYLPRRTVEVRPASVADSQKATLARPASATTLTVSPPTSQPSKRGKVYNRRLLNKHDDALLAFLAVVRVANTRILSLAVGKTERQVQQRLKGLQELGLTDNRLLAGTQAIWVVTPKGVRTLRKRGLLEDRPYVLGTRLDLLKNSSLGHKLAEATVAAHFVNGHRADLLGKVSWQDLVHENEVSAGFQRARKLLDYDATVRPSDVCQRLRRLSPNEEWIGVEQARLYLARRNGPGQPDQTKLPDLVVNGSLRVAVEVELYPKGYEDYLAILETYRQDMTTYDRVLYVVREKGTALLIMKAATEVHRVAKRARIDSSDMWLNAPRSGATTAEMLAEQRRIAEDFFKLDGKLIVQPLYGPVGTRFTGDPWLL